MESNILSQHVEYKLFDDLDSFGDYTDFISDLSSMTAEDRVTIKINSGGGRIDIGHMIIQAIENTKAFVHAEVVHASYSMASLIALSCDSLVMYPNTLLMFHNYTSGCRGKGAELVQSVVYADEYLQGILHDSCSPFLSKKELDKIIDDHDVYIKWDDPTLKTRIRRHF